MKAANAKLSSKSQLVLPKLVREKLRLKTGDSVRFIDSPAGTGSVAVSSAIAYCA